MLRREGCLGMKAKPKKLSAKERSEKARNAALCRWNSHNIEKQLLKEDPLFERLLKVYTGRPMD